MKRILALTLLLAATAAAGQDDPLDLQRCIWRCLADASGPEDPAYGACVKAQCEAAPAPHAPWVYGNHPLLGRGAFGQTAQGVVGLACGASGPPLDLRLTNSFFRGPAVTIMFDDAPTAFSLGPAPGGASQRSGTACDLDLEAFKRAATLYLIDGAIAAAIADPQGTVLTLQGAGRTVAVRSAAEAYAALGGAAVSLAGSAAAIDRLIAACPAARADAAYECGE